MISIDNFDIYRYNMFAYFKKVRRMSMENNVNDNGGFLWGLLGCCIPIAGLILFLVWKDQKPKTAKAAGIGALVSVILLVAYYIVVFVILGAAGIASGAF